MKLRRDLIALLAAASHALAADAPEGLELFEKRIRPALLAHCVECHGGEKQKGALRVDSRDALRTGGDSGAAVVPGKPADSLLLTSIKHLDSDMKMPSKAPKLDDALIADFERWITLGAPDPRDHPPTAAEASAAAWEPKFNEWKKWWCFQPVRKTEPPAVKNAAWSSHPVDRFLLAAMEARGLAPAHDADPRTLSRRLSYALTGLPPTPDLLDLPVEAATDRLLASPRFGEHWARHWMDLVRFAETHGSEGDPEIPQAWMYRDYLIRAFNDDVPLGQLIREHLAGDLLPNPRRHDHANESAIGVAHLRLVEHGFQPVDTRDEQIKTLDSQIDTVMKAFQSLTVSCARCHDHKFDPISQRDYYALQGVFANSRPAMITIDDPALLKQHDAALTALKAKLKARLATAWREEAARFPERLRSIDASRSQQQQLTQRISEIEKQIGDLDARGREKLLGAGKAALPVAPAARWSFESDARDAFGKLDGELLGTAVVRKGRLVLDGSDAQMRTAPLARDLREKTLEAWAAPANLDQRGGGVLTVEDKRGSVFDSLVFAEKAARRWVIGSNNFRRSTLLDAPDETASPGELVHLVGVWRADRSIACFRNGKPYGESFTPKDEDVAVFTAADARVLLGLRHSPPAKGKLFAGEIDEARLYDRALDPTQIAASFAAGPDAGLATPAEITAALNADERTQRKALDAQLAAVRRELAALDHVVPTAWRTAIEAAKANAAHPLHVIAGGKPATPAAAPKLAWNLADPKDSAQWFRHGSGLPAQPFRAGSFSVLPTSDRLLDALLPAGFHTHALSRKHSGILQSPRFKIDSDFISVHGAGGGGAQVRVIVDGYPLPSNPIYPRAVLDKAEPGWVRLDSKYRRGSWAYLEIATREDLTRRYDKKGGAKDEASWFAVDAVVFHDESNPPTDAAPELAISAEALTARAVEAIGSWTRDELRESDRTFLHALIRADLLPTRAAAPLLAEYRKLEAAIPEPRRVPGALESDHEDAPLLPRGDHLKPGDLVPRGYLSVVDAAPFAQSDTSRSGRLELARAITDPRNPLTARVMVNRVWHWIFGRGLAGTPDNFGRMGQPPTHPELLDTLATRFAAPEAEGGFAWSTKKLVRFLVTTRAFALASEPPAKAAELDAPNDLLTHARVRRLEAEAIRDTLLTLAGQTDAAMFGPGDNALSKPDDQHRRSVYLTIRRNTLSPFLGAFDSPKPFATTGRRDETNVPAQSLTLLNDPFVIHCAGQWAQRAVQSSVDLDTLIGGLMTTAFGRPPSGSELSAARTFVTDLARTRSLSTEAILGDRDLWRDFAHSLINAKEFIYLR